MIPELHYALFLSGIFSVSYVYFYHYILGSLHIKIASCVLFLFELSAHSRLLVSRNLIKVCLIYECIHNKISYIRYLDIVLVKVYKGVTFDTLQCQDCE